MSVWELHLKAALLLVRDLRAKAVMQGLDPRAVRVALKYALLIDFYCMKEHGISSVEEQQMDALANKLFKQTPRIEEKKKND